MRGPCGPLGFQRKRSSTSLERKRTNKTSLATYDLIRGTIWLCLYHFYPKVAQLRAKKDLSLCLPCGGKRKHRGWTLEFLYPCGMLPKVIISLLSRAEDWIVSYVTGGKGVWGEAGENSLGIKGTQVLAVSQIPSRSPCLTTGNEWLTGPQPYPSALCLTHTFSLPYGQLPVYISDSSMSRLVTEQEQKASQTCGPDRDHKFELWCQLWKNKREAVSTQLDVLSLQRRHTSLSILPQERAISINRNSLTRSEIAWNLLQGLTESISIPKLVTLEEVMAISNKTATQNFEAHEKSN